MRKTIIPDWFKPALEIDGRQAGFPKTAAIPEADFGKTDAP